MHFIKSKYPCPYHYTHFSLDKKSLPQRMFTDISEHAIRTPASAPPAPITAGKKPAPIRPAV